MAFTREITQILVALLLAIFVVISAALYWSIVGSDSILARTDNPRLVLNDATIQRGSIYDRNGVPLVETTLADNGTLQRTYYYEAFYSALGYFSLRYGVDGAEAAFDTILRGDRLMERFGTQFERDVLHRPQMGENILLTLDQSTQQQLADLMDEQTGAAVMLHVPSGEVLALLSQPTFNPNTLDADWETLREAPEQAFFNRALLGQYQPGGMMQTPLSIAAALTQQSFSATFPDATQPIVIDDLSLNCVADPPTTTLSLTQAYAFGCPQPFDALLTALNPATLSATVDALQLSNPPAIDRFGSVQALDTTPTASTDTSDSLRADLLGQGELTTNPLSLATLTAAIVNEGNAPQPYMLQQTRIPDGEWIAATETLASLPMMTTEAAAQLQDLLRSNLDAGVVEAAELDDLQGGAHAAIAFSGDGTQVWFIGFAQRDGGEHVVIALILENTDDITAAVQIGSEALQAAVNALDA